MLDPIFEINEKLRIAAQSDEVVLYQILFHSSPLLLVNKYNLLGQVSIHDDLRNHTFVSV